jgi:DNA-binding MarR family transcriptional regulator
MEHQEDYYGVSADNFDDENEELVTDGGVGDSTQPAQAAVADPELTKFQLRTLAILAEEARYGLAIKRELAQYYGKVVNHGQLYPNLDTLVEKGFVAKTELDQRTNEYSLTDAGAQALAEEIHWIAHKFGLDIKGGGGDD